MISPPDEALVENAAHLYREFGDRKSQPCMHQLTNAAVCTYVTWRKKRRMSMQALLTVDQLAGYLRKSVASIRSDATRNPQSLPPVCRLPGTKRLLWRVEDVESWLSAHVGSSVVAIEPEQKAAAPRRGRPTKAEQMARQRHEGIHSGRVPADQSAR
jgi:hypothetical protein